jgi:acyl-CoA reductase-like NAD-dependent aldehyde dehydrogenase
LRLRKRLILSVLRLSFVIKSLVEPKAYKTSWGLKCPGSVRGKLLNKLADLIEANIDEFAALEALDVGELVDFHIVA